MVLFIVLYRIDVLKMNIMTSFINLKNKILYESIFRGQSHLFDYINIFFDDECGRKTMDAIKISE